MWSLPKQTADLVTFTEEILNGKLHFFVISTFLVLDDLEQVDRLAIITYRRSHPEVLLGKGVLKTSSKFTGEHRCQIAISIKLQSSFMEITLRHGCSPVNFLHIFRTPFYKSTSRGCLWPMKYQAISGQCSISIPPENVKKPLVFWLFLGGIEMTHCFEMD